MVLNLSGSALSGSGASAGADPAAATEIQPGSTLVYYYPSPPTPGAFPPYSALRLLEIGRSGQLLRTYPLMTDYWDEQSISAQREHEIIRVARGIASRNPTTNQPIGTSSISQLIRVDRQNQLLGVIVADLNDVYGEFVNCQALGVDPDGRIIVVHQSSTFKVKRFTFAGVEDGSWEFDLPSGNGTRGQVDPPAVNDVVSYFEVTGPNAGGHSEPFGDVGQIQQTDSGGAAPVVSRDGRYVYCVTTQYLYTYDLQVGGDHASVIVDLDGGTERGPYAFNGGIAACADGSVACGVEEVIVPAQTEPVWVSTTEYKDAPIVLAPGESHSTIQNQAIYVCNHNVPTLPAASYVLAQGKPSWYYFQESVIVFRGSVTGDEINIEINAPGVNIDLQYPPRDALDASQFGVHVGDPTFPPNPSFNTFGIGLSFAIPGTAIGCGTITNHGPGTLTLGQDQTGNSFVREPNHWNISTTGVDGFAQTFAEFKLYTRRYSATGTQLSEDKLTDNVDGWKIVDGSIPQQASDHVGGPTDVYFGAFDNYPWFEFNPWSAADENTPVPMVSWFQASPERSDPSDPDYFEGELWYFRGVSQSRQMAKESDDTSQYMVYEDAQDAPSPGLARYPGKDQPAIYGEAL